MCGRFTQAFSPAVIAEIFHALGVPELLPKRYNIAPSQEIAAVRTTESGRQFAWLRWGLVPAWAKDRKIAPANAMAETAAEKPFFRTAFKKRRCLIPADGWFEWQPTGAKQKQPYFFCPVGHKPLALAGLWETWDREGEVLETCALLTTDANEVAAAVHNRMPCILAPDAFDAWLDPGRDAASLKDLLGPCPADRLFAWKVSTYVNNVKNQGPGCIEPAA